MAAEGVCPFPLPPAQYYKLYTDENVENKTAPEPPPPLNGSYSMFGASFEVNEILHRWIVNQKYYGTVVNYHNIFRHN